jgi:putative ABC transport system substrate-binding protein
VPSATTIAALLNPATTAAADQPRSIEAAGRSMGLQVHILHASTEGEIYDAFAALERLHAQALLIANDGLFTIQSQRLGSLASQHAMPAIFQTREFAAAGGLMSYGGEPFQEEDRQAGHYVGRILKGAKPGELPVVQPTKVELIINLKTAKALGLTAPQTLLYRADEVIE